MAGRFSRPSIAAHAILNVSHLLLPTYPALA
jgi:hypothetical protein